MSDRIKDPSPLVQAVLALDDYFSELDRLGTKITQMDLKSDFDFEHAQRLMNRFAECGQGVASEVMRLSNFLNEARTRAEQVAQAVSARAELLKSRKGVEHEKFEEFRLLGEKVRELSAAMSKWKRSDDEAPLTEEERQELSSSLEAFEEQLNPLIERAQNLRQEARESKMKTLEQNADALTQTLQAIRQKLSLLHASPKAH